MASPDIDPERVRIVLILSHFDDTTATSVCFDLSVFESQVSAREKAAQTVKEATEVERKNAEV